MKQPTQQERILAILRAVLIIGLSPIWFPLALIAAVLICL
jgi:hypothetical protein